MVAKNNPEEIQLVRTYNAPVQTVWDAWNDPEQVAHWWGPRGFTLTSHSKDLKPGGHWFYTMHGPDGVDYVNKTIYYEVEQYKKLVYDHGGNDERQPLFRVTVLFSEADGQTTMVMTMRLPTAEEAAKTRKFIKAAGGNATWDRLGEYLNTKLRGQSTFVINRAFTATPEQLFELWLQPEHLAQWLPPPEFDMTFLSQDVRVGGSCFFKMSSTQTTLHGTLEYREISAPNRLVYIQRFCNEQGGPGRHPALPTFPEALLMTIEFIAEDEETTRILLTAQPYGETSEEEKTVFEQTRASMTGGWTASFDKLEGLTGTSV